MTINDLRGASLQICPNSDMLIQYQNSDVNVVDVLLKASLDISDIINLCGISNYWVQKQDCDKLFVKSVTEYGICFTFNMLGHDSVFNQGTSSDFDTFKRTRIAKSWDPEQLMNESRHEDDNEPSTWSLESGYLSDDEFIQPTRANKKQTFFIGIVNGINESFCEEREFPKNYKMFLHLPNELPQISYETIDIPLGTDDHILISADVMHYEDSLKNFAPEKRGCYYEGEKPLKIFKSYTKANCEYECMTNFAYSTCGCIKFSMPRTKDMKVCGCAQNNCAEAIAETFPRSYYENAENKKKFPDYPCGCLPSCTEIKYKTIKTDRKNREKE